MSYSSTVTGTRGSTATTRTWTLPSTGVQVGDLVVAVLPCIGHLLSPGYDTYQGPRLALPARWQWIGAATVQRGGDPARLQECVLFAALVAETGDMGATFTFTSLQEAPLSDATWENAYPVQPHAHVFRGEVGVNALRVAAASGASAITPAEGWTPTGAGTDIIEAAAAHTYTATPDGSGGTTITWRPADLRITDKAGGHTAAYDVTTTVADTMTSRALYDGASTATMTATTATISVSSTRSPLRPELTSPAAGAVVDAVAQGLNLGWVYRQSTAGAQTGYAVRRTSGATTQWWTGSAWDTTETILTGNAQTLALPAGATHWTYGTTYAVSVATKGFTGSLGDYSVAASVQVAAAPTLTLAIVDQQADTTVPDTTPTIIGTATPASGLSITAWQAEILDGSSVVVTSGSGLGSATSWTVTLPLANGLTYTARMRVQQTGGAWSPWVTKAFKVLLTGAPVVVAGSSYLDLITHETSGVPGVAIYVALGGSVPYESTPTLVELERSTDLDAWEPIATATTAGVGWVLFRDYGAPTAASVAYRARGTATVNGRSTTGDWQVLGPIVHDFDDLTGWLLCPDRPELATRLTYAHTRSAKRGSGGVAVKALGRADKLVTNLGATLPTYEWTGRADSLAQRDTVVAILTSGETVIYRNPPVVALLDEVRESTPDVYGHVVGEIGDVQDVESVWAPRILTATIEADR